MQFFVSLTIDPEKAKVPPPEHLAEAEKEIVRGLYMDGFVRQIWLRADAKGALAIVEAGSAAIVAERFATLPLVREGILQPPEVAALAPYWGFAPRG